MWFKHRAWIPIAWVLSLANIGSVWFAAQPAEPWHATVHALLAVAFGVGAQRLTARRGRGAQRSADLSAIREGAELRESQSEILKRVEQGVEAIAIELERVGEGQRFLTKVLAESPRNVESGSRASQPASLPVPGRQGPNEES